MTSPVRHVERLADLSRIEFVALLRAAEAVNEMVSATLGTAGTYFFLNDGRVAGQESPHVHVHDVSRRSPADSRSTISGGWHVVHAEGMDSMLADLPPEFLQASFSERMIPGRQPELGLGAGSNCQRYAYAVLRHFGLSIPDHRSSELWADEEVLTTVSDPEPLDLVLFAASPDPWGAHVGLYIGGSAVLHLCKEIGVPVVWDFTDFAERERYASLIGFKRVRTL